MTLALASSVTKRDQDITACKVVGVANRLHATLLMGNHSLDEQIE